MGDHLRGKVAIVTGSGQGIGRAIACALADEGAKVVTNNRAPQKAHNEPNQLSAEQITRLTPELREWVQKELDSYAGDAESTAAAIRVSGGDAIAAFGDISDFNAAKKIVGTAVAAYGTVDIIVNVAGAFGFAPVDKINEELWDRVTGVKPKGYFNIIRHAVPYMKKNGWGRIINCSSPAFLGGDLRQAEYCTANAGVLGLTWSLAWELAQFGITSNAFAPGAKTRASVDMEVFDKTVSQDERSTASGKAFGSYDDTAPPEQFAPFIAWLATEQAGHVNGSVFFCGGGFIGLLSNPAMKTSMFREGGWTVDGVSETAPDTLLSGYRNILETSAFAPEDGT